MEEKLLNLHNIDDTHAHENNLEYYCSEFFNEVLYKKAMNKYFEELRNWHNIPWYKRIFISKPSKPEYEIFITY